MLFAEEHARLLLVLHTVLGAALVAVSTHLAVWMRGFPKGRYQRLDGVRKLAAISAGLFGLAFVAGNLLYPVYKVRVRAQFLDHPTALMRDQIERERARAQVAARYQDTGAADLGGADQAALADADIADLAGDLPREAAKMARWFDVKEHWVAFGLIAALGCAVLAFAWNPKRDGGAIASIAFLLAVAAASTAWLGALIGVLAASYRAVGGP